MLCYLAMIETEEERSKFEKIYIQYRRLMYSVAFRVLNNSEDAEDAVHTAFIRIAKNIEIINDDVGSLTGLMITIARNTAIDIYRKRSKQATVELTDDIEAPNTETNLDESAGCLEKLPERQKTILLLKYHYGYNNDEIAKLLDITPTNVAKIVYRAKVKLREYYEKEDVL